MDPFLRRGQELGFTLSELQEFDRLSRSSRSGGVLAAAATLAAENKLREIDEKVADLRRTREAIAGLLAFPCFDPSTPCPIISAVVGELVATQE